jgi:hypothetical protein
MNDEPTLEWGCRLLDAPCVATARLWNANLMDNAIGEAHTADEVEARRKPVKLKWFITEVICDVCKGCWCTLRPRALRDQLRACQALL